MSNELRSVELSSEERESLRRQFLRIDEITPFIKDLKFASAVASLGIMREVGTVNDELARFIFDADRGEVIPLESLKATLVELGGLLGVSIRSNSSARLDIRARGLRELLHPKF